MATVTKVALTCTIMVEVSSLRWTHKNKRLSGPEYNELKSQAEYKLRKALQTQDLEVIGAIATKQITQHEE